MSVIDPSRRETLAGLAALAALPAVACGGECGSRTGAQTEGPYYPGEPEARVDVTEGLAGVPLEVTLLVLSSMGCEPVADAEVDLWSADAAGDYSGYDDFGTEGEEWLRGQQISSAEGEVTFTTVVPGAYPGRAIHLHVKVRGSGFRELTTQVYLPDDVVAQVLERADYDASSAQVTNDDDDFYAGDTLLTVTGDAVTGLVATGVLVV